jgi:hypothetical protein
VLETSLRARVRPPSVAGVSTLLQNLAEQKATRLERERLALLAALRAALIATLPPGETVWIFGSPSDIDLALERRPAAFSEFWLQGELELRLGRRVDVVLLPETRLREKIERDGLRWIL